MLTFLLIIPKHTSILSVLRILYCATNKKYYFLVCTTWKCLFVMFSNNAQCKKLVYCACAPFTTFTVYKIFGCRGSVGGDIEPWILVAICNYLLFAINKFTCMCACIRVHVCICVAVAFINVNPRLVLGPFRPGHHPFAVLDGNGFSGFHPGSIVIR